MTYNLSYILFAALMAFGSTKAQDKKLKNANESFAHYEYSKAIDRYEELVESGFSTSEIYKNLGDANYLNANYEEATKWYEMLSNMVQESMSIEHTYRYAQSLRSIKKYRESDQIMEKLGRMTQNDLRVLAFANGKDYLDKILKNSGRFTIENIDINSPASDFSPSFTENGLVFSTGRDTSGVSKNLHSWNKKRFLSLYATTLSEDGTLSMPFKFTKKLNTKVHESSTVFTKEGTTVYFTRNNVKSGNFARDEAGISRLKIYRARLKNGTWKNIKALPFNSDDYSVAHPALNKAENKLYFSSDMPGTSGKSDIFVVDINSDGTFGTPKNLGSKINTESKETFPFVSDDDILYFASDGHPGLGGMDVFATDLKNEEGYIVNVGEPINSIFDDFSFIIDTASKKGYFASNRTEGKGDDDIYALVQLNPLDLKSTNGVSGTTKDKKTGALLANAKVMLLTSNGSQLATTISDAKGAFSFDIDCKNLQYNLIATKDNYEKDKVSFANKGEEPIASVVLTLSQTDKGAPVGTDLAKYLNIEPIYFDFDKWNIRPETELSIQKVVTYLNTYPTAKLSIGSHTDSRASKAYNIRLSDKRAYSNKDYLIKKGIAVNRLSAIGLGETMLANECADAVPCSEEKHQQNRRSTFIVVE